MKYGLVFWDLDGTLYERDLVPYQGLPNLLSRIPSNLQGLITNGYDEVQRNKLKEMGLIEYFNPDLILTSYGEAEQILDSREYLDLDLMFNDDFRINELEEVVLQTQKPNSYMFQKALEISQVCPGDCVMIGDSWFDICGAQRVGMKTIFVEGNTRKSQEDLYLDKLVTPDFRIQKGDVVNLEKLLF